MMPIMPTAPFSASRSAAGSHSTWLDLLLAAGILLAALLLVRGIAAPWNGYGDSDGALFGSMARNYLQFGILKLQFGQLVTYEAITEPIGVYYLHHPPLVPLLSAASIALFGDSELSVRLVSVSATLLTAVLLYGLARRSLERRGGLLCALLFLAYPSTIIFGRKPGYEALTLCLIVLGLWLYVRYREDRSGTRLAALLGAVALGGLSDWAAYLLPAALLVLEIANRHGRTVDRALIAGLLLVPSAVLCAFLYSIWRVDPASVLDLAHQGLAYTGLFAADGAVVANIKEARIDFTAGEYLFRIVGNLDRGFGLMALLLAALGLVALRERPAIRAHVFVLGFAALLTLLVFWRSLYFHLWWLQLLAAPLALLGAAAVHALQANLGTPSATRRRGTELAVLFAVLVPVAVGMVYNVRALGSEQIRVLPEHLRENPDFIPELGRRLGALTAPGERVLTNLAAVPSSIANPYARILPYYARRGIEAGIQHPDEAADRFAAGAGTHFLLGPLDDPGTATDALAAWLRTRSEARSFDVQGHRFALYRIPGTSGTAAGDKETYR